MSSVIKFINVYICISNGLINEICCIDNGNIVTGSGSRSLGNIVTIGIA